MNLSSNRARKYLPCFKPYRFLKPIRFSNTYLNLKINNKKNPHQLMRISTISKWSVPAIEDQKQSAFWLRHYRSTARSF